MATKALPLAVQWDYSCSASCATVNQFASFSVEKVTIERAIADLIGDELLKVFVQALQA